MQEAVFTRDWTEVDTEEFWESFFKKQAYTGPETDLHFWTPDHVVTADAINGALFKKLRDQAISAREVFNITDLFLYSLCKLISILFPSISIATD